MAADRRKASSPCADPLGLRCKDVIIASKFGQAELLCTQGWLTSSSARTKSLAASRRWIMQAVEESLTRLKTDYIDLYHGACR